MSPEKSVYAVELRGVTHRFAGKEGGLFDINLAVEQGRFVVLAGANGSGKTTLLRHLNGLLAPQQGVVLVEGVAVGADVKRARRKVGMIFQDADSQIVGETVLDDVVFGPENLGWPRTRIKAAAAAAIATVGLSDMADHSPYLLSGGEKRRLAIAGVLAMQSEIIVLDEPFANLDFPGVRQVLQQLITLHRQGRTIIVSTHDLEKVIAHADRLVILHHGRVVLDGPPLEVMRGVERYGIRLPCAVRSGGDPQSWLN